MQSAGAIMTFLEGGQCSQTEVLKSNQIKSNQIKSCEQLGLLLKNVGA